MQKNLSFEYNIYYNHFLQEKQWDRGGESRLFLVYFHELFFFLDDFCPCCVKYTCF